jgi:hypothetical protein
MNGSPYELGEGSSVRPFMPIADDDVDRSDDDKYLREPKAHRFVIAVDYGTTFTGNFAYVELTRATLTVLRSRVRHSQRR